MLAAFNSPEGDFSSLHCENTPVEGFCGTTGESVPGFMAVKFGLHDRGRVTVRKDREDVIEQWTTI